ncbi:transcriptional repressor LexA [Alkalibacter rhizosphaerae]|uniref:LexA repressor n=1 Tax=Alkalibacter rhizosphaerae TaxID=2815577 RepID=A0A974XHL7_9FIRM|nr:transcriptional repressor LexA [Alkalibacter rhizosphaerae]QSX08895.1 transcriptional repressor LexA [Alkalibacter rhizosphaerae]
MEKELSKKQQDILEFIIKEVQKKGYPPSVREICQAVSLKSTSTVHGHLEKLENKGFIRRDPTLPRAIEILARNDSPMAPIHKEMVNVPVVGRVTAGQPILAVENIEDSFPLPMDFIGKNESFILCIRGDSMIDAGILDGDYVIVEKRNTALNGDIVVALIDEEEATVKRFYKEKGHIRLQPENSAMEPIIVSDARILGKVTGVLRKL